MSKLKYYRVGVVDVFYLKNPSPIAIYKGELFLFKRMGSYARASTHTPNGKRLVRVVIDSTGKKGSTVVLQSKDKSILEVPAVDVKFLELSIEGIIIDKVNDLEYIINSFSKDSGTIDVVYRIRSGNVTIRCREKVFSLFKGGFFNLDLPPNFNYLLGYVEF